MELSTSPLSAAGLNLFLGRTLLPHLQSARGGGTSQVTSRTQHSRASKHWVARRIAPLAEKFRNVHASAKKSIFVNKVLLRVAVLQPPTRPRVFGIQ